METTKISIRIPERIYREIKWSLFNYNNLDKFIKYREKFLKDDIFDYYHFTYKNNLKSIRSYGHTLENCIIALDEDKVIKRYKKWQKVIRDYLNELDNQNNYIDYWIIQYNFFQHRSYGFIQEHLNLEEKEFKRELFIIIYEIYIRAIKEKLYREVVECQIVK